MASLLKEDTQDRRLTVFISYSRMDTDFADRLLAALELRDQDVLVDRRDIPLGEELKLEILDFIHRSDAVVFIVSPNSIRSAWCKWELEQVKSESKRLIPIVLTPVPLETLPTQISDLNLLRFDDGADFERNMDVLAEVLSRDQAWLKEHTRLGAAARRWSAKTMNAAERGEDVLLRGHELDEAELWISRRPRGAPEPTDRHRVFIQESRKAGQARAAEERRQIERARRFQKRASWALSAVGLLVLAFLFAAGLQSRLTFKREANVFAQLATDAFNDGFYDRALRYAIAGLPPRRGSLSLVMPWSEQLEANLVSSAELSQLNVQLSGHLAPLSSASFDPEGLRIVTGSGDSTARIWTTSTGEPTTVLSGHTAWVRNTTFSPDGRRILTSSDDGTARLWDASTGKELAVLDGSRARGWPIRSASFSRDGSRIVTAAAMIARVWDAASGRLIVELKGHEEDVRVAAFSPDGSRVVTACGNVAILRDSSVRVWDVKTGRVISEFAGQGYITQSAVFSPDGKTVLTGSGDSIARLSDAESGATLKEFKGHTGPVFVAAFNIDGTRIVTGSFDKTARIWDARTGAQIAELKGGHTDLVTTAKFNPDKESVLTASPDGTAILWDSNDGAVILRLKGHTGDITSASFSSDGRQILTASTDATARIWSATPRAAKAVFGAGESGAPMAILSPNGTQMLTHSASNVVSLWDAGDGTVLTLSKGFASPAAKFASFSRDARRILFNTWEGVGRVIEAESYAPKFEIGSKDDPLTAAIFSPDGSKILSGSRGGVTRLWDARSGSLIWDARPIGEPISGVAYSPHSLRFATVSGNTASVFDAESGNLVSVLRGHDAPIWKIAFDSMDKHLVTASADATARLWDAATGAEICRTNGHSHFVATAAFSPDGKHFVTSSWDNTARVWNAQDCSPISVLRPHPGAVSDAEFSPDGRIVATASGDASNSTNPSGNAVRLWNAASGMSIAVLTGHRRPVSSVAFNEDGTLLTTTSRDGTARLWNVDLVTGWFGRELLEKVCQERLVGAQAFLTEELQQPVLAGMPNANPCERGGPLSLRYWEDAIENLYR